MSTTHTTYTTEMQNVNSLSTRDTTRITHTFQAFRDGFENDATAMFFLRSLFPGWLVKKTLTGFSLQEHGMSPVVLRVIRVLPPSTMTSCWHCDGPLTDGVCVKCSEVAK